MSKCLGVLRSRVILVLLPLACAAPQSRVESPEEIQPARSASVPRTEAALTAADYAASHALRMVGRPYRSGGSNPSTGFDCSGLVQYSFRQAGLYVPRSTEEQRRAATLVDASNLRNGDLLFFDEPGQKNAHVGIYVGHQVFVHAPASSKRVGHARLDSPYWSKQLSEVRRF